MKEDGEQLDNSAPPMYDSHLRDIVRAYKKDGHASSVMRALVLVSLWFAAGRSSEVAWLTFDSLRWDDYHHCVVQEVLQSKTSKSKLVAYVAGSWKRNREDKSRKQGESWKGFPVGFERGKEGVEPLGSAPDQTLTLAETKSGAVRPKYRVKRSIS